MHSEHRRKRMADDREVLRGIWEAKLPISFLLSPDEVSAVNGPEPFYLMVPRLHYFPLVTEKVRKHFAQFIKPESQNKEMWLEYNGVPIKWHYPIGLWFDLYAASDLTLPWPINVHFEEFPETKILRCTSKDAIRSQFMSTIKEADALKHKGNVINSMQEKDHHQLWAGFQTDRFDQFWSINKKLMESNPGEGFRYIPIRFYTTDSPLLQRLVRPFDDITGTWTTLQDVLMELFPRITFNSKQVTIHGIPPPLDTPLQWLSEHLSYPDNFLHIALTMKESHS